MRSDPLPPRGRLFSVGPRGLKHKREIKKRAVRRYDYCPRLGANQLDCSAMQRQVAFEWGRQSHWNACPTSSNAQSNAQASSGGYREWSPHGGAVHCRLSTRPPS